MKMPFVHFHLPHRNGGLSEAQRSREQAERELAQTRADTPMVKAIAASLRDLRERNHFSDAIEASFRERNHDS